MIFVICRFRPKPMYQCCIRLSVFTNSRICRSWNSVIDSVGDLLNLAVKLGFQRFPRFVESIIYLNCCQTAFVYASRGDFMLSIAILSRSTILELLFV